LAYHSFHYYTFAWNFPSHPLFATVFFIVTLLLLYSYFERIGDFMGSNMSPKQIYIIDYCIEKRNETDIRLCMYRFPLHIAWIDEHLLHVNKSEFSLLINRSVIDSNSANFQSFSILLCMYNGLFRTILLTYPWSWSKYLGSFYYDFDSFRNLLHNTYGTSVCLGEIVMKLSDVQLPCRR
jgi:hypothetical protein